MVTSKTRKPGLPDLTSFTTTFADESGTSLLRRATSPSQYASKSAGRARSILIFSGSNNAPAHTYRVCSFWLSAVTPRSLLVPSYRSPRRRTCPGLSSLRSNTVPSLAISTVFDEP